MHRLPGFGALLVGLVIAHLSGCVTSTIQEVREADTGMESGDAVVVLGRRTRPTPGETEMDFISCVANGMSRGDNSVSVIDEQQFLDDMFPWFEPRTAPINTSDLPELINQPLLASRLDQMGLKYLVWIEGSTRRTDSAGSLTCTVTAGAAGCFGFLSWENDSSYEASVWDVKTGKTAGRISSEAIGTSYMPAIIIPIPLIARVRSSACSSLAGQLKSFVQNKG
ncbi:MAG: hypothetical protein O7C67_02655 [Gammaproteobacteria bacterium]|nr:hypothetical protein [Gammaproteobacteria bacterium]